MIFASINDGRNSSLGSALELSALDVIRACVLDLAGTGSHGAALFVGVVVLDLVDGGDAVADVWDEHLLEDVGGPVRVTRALTAAEENQY